MDLFLIRHGESVNNTLTDVSQRVADPALTARGRAQVRRLAEFAAAAGHLDPPERGRGPAFDRIYCSPMLRALQTAAPLAECLGMVPEVWVDVHEVGGLWLESGELIPGPQRSRLEADFPGVVLPAGVRENGWWSGGQEMAHAGRGRAIGVAAQLRARARAAAAGNGKAWVRPRERVAIVTHGDFMSALVMALADHLPSWGLYYVHHNTAITRFQLDPEGCVIHYLNRVDHLDDPGLA